MSESHPLGETRGQYATVGGPRGRIVYDKNASRLIPVPMVPLTHLDCKTFTVHLEDVMAIWPELEQYQRVWSILSYISKTPKIVDGIEYCNKCNICERQSYLCLCDDAPLKFIETEIWELEIIESIFTHKHKKNQEIFPSYVESTNEAIQREEYEYDEYYRDCKHCKWPSFLCHCDIYGYDVGLICKLALRNECDLCSDEYDCVSCYYNRNECICNSDYGKSCGECYKCIEMGEEYCEETEYFVLNRYYLTCEHCGNKTICDPKISICPNGCNCYEQCIGCQQYCWGRSSRISPMIDGCKCKNEHYEKLFHDVQLPFDTLDYEARRMLLRKNIPLYILLEQRCFKMPFYEFVRLGTTLNLETLSIYMYEIMTFMACIYLPHEILNIVVGFLEPKSIRNKKENIGYSQLRSCGNGNGDDLIIPMNKMFEMKHSDIFFKIFN
jgi:hypothetical protein